MDTRPDRSILEAHCQDTLPRTTTTSPTRLISARTSVCGQTPLCPELRYYARTASLPSQPARCTRRIPRDVQRRGCSTSNQSAGFEICQCPPHILRQRAPLVVLLMGRLITPWRVNTHPFRPGAYRKGSVRRMVSG